MNNNLTIMEKLDSLAIKIDDHTGGRWLNTRKAAQYCGLSNRTIHRAVRSGELKAGGTEGKILFKKSWLDEWIEGRIR